MVLKSLSRGLGSAAGVSILGYQVLPTSLRSSALDDFAASLLQSASSLLKGVPTPGLPASVSSSNAEISALLVSQQTVSRSMEHLLRLQARSNARAAIGWLFPAGVVVALVGAWYKWGWAGFGWVSLEQLQDGLDALKVTLGQRIQQLRDEVMLRFTRIEDAIHQSRDRLEQMNKGMSELRDETVKGNSTMSALERRLSSVESNTRRSAQGIELLVHLVSASNLFADADDESLIRLREFTGALPAPSDSAPMLRETHSAPQLLERSSSSFVQMLLAPSVTSP